MITKWPVQKTNTYNSTKHTEYQDVVDIQNKLFVCFGIFILFLFYFRFLKMSFQEL